MRIDALLTPFFPEKEKQFTDAIVVMIDVLRASTTICAALYNGAKELIPADSHERAAHIYNGLNREMRFLGGETNGLKPGGFDAGNSPSEYSEEFVKGKTVILSTSNGTKIFQKARFSKARLIGAFVNYSIILNYIEYHLSIPENGVNQLIFMCAGSDGRLSYEDTLCAGAFISAIHRNNQEYELTDSAHAAKNLYNMHIIDLKEFLRKSEHSIYLQSLNCQNDIETALSFDLYPVVALTNGTGIKKFDLPVL